MSFVKSLFRFVSSVPVYAHCDVPCGIYDPRPAQIAAATVLKMVEKIDGLVYDDSADAKANFVRMVWTKEEHVRKCKEELLILWTDFFKPKHIKLFPDLYVNFLMIQKL